LELFPNQSSGVLTSTVWGDGLIDNPPGRAIARGDSVSFISMAELLA
jgi:molybdopterin molybdotransferase